MKFKNEGSLERSLLVTFPGCSNVLEALAKVKQNKNQTALQTPLKEPTSEYEAMRDAINTITTHSKGFDFDLMDAKVRKDLSEIKIDSIEGVNLWRDSWVTVLGKGKAGRRL